MDNHKFLEHIQGLYQESVMQGKENTAWEWEAKFAEAIIRECAAVALREDHDPYECILNHFGLK